MRERPLDVSTAAAHTLPTHFMRHSHITFRLLTDMSSALASRAIFSHLSPLSRTAARRTYSTARPSGTHAPRSARRLVATAAGAAVLSVTTYTLGSLYPPELATYISPRAAPAPPDVHSPAALAHTVALEGALHALPPLLAHRARADADEWYETRPYLRVPEERRVNSLTAGALRGPGRLAVPPLVRARKDESEALVFVHVGRGLCGHDGIIHGGLLATLMDEALGRIVSYHCFRG